MRKLNVKFLFFLLLGVTAVAGALLVVHRLQAANIANALLYAQAYFQRAGVASDRQTIDKFRGESVAQLQPTAAPAQ